MSGFDRLTKTEAEILKLMTAGMSAQEIADARSISINTVRAHSKMILMKLEVHTQLKAVCLVHESQIDQIRDLVHEQSAGYGTEPWLTRLREIVQTR